MLSGIKGIVSIGASSGDSFEDQRIIIINITTLMAVFFSLLFIVTYIIYNLWKPLIFNAIVIVCYLGVIFLNFLKNRRLPGPLLSALAIIQMFSLSVIFLGRDTGIHFFLLAVISLTFLTFIKSKKLLIALFIMIASGAFIFIEYGFWQSPFIDYPPPELSKLFHIMSTSGTVAIIAVVILVFYVLLHNAQESLEFERQRAENLLLNILPSSIAQRLKEENIVIADNFEKVSILFADIVDFTSFSERLSPESLVDLLNDIFSLFDKLVEQYDLEKIKTIGDAYMVAGGLPSPREDSLEAIADLALAMLKAIERFNEENNRSFEIRIGIHAGAAVAGVIGIKKFIYDVWGDTVNTASRMESHGIPGKIQVSERVFELLKYKYTLEERGIIEVKGKGEMKTYLLLGINSDIEPNH